MNLQKYIESERKRLLSSTYLKGQTLIKNDEKSYPEVRGCCSYLKYKNDYKKVIVIKPNAVPYEQAKKWIKELKEMFGFDLSIRTLISNKLLQTTYFGVNYIPFLVSDEQIEIFEEFNKIFRKIIMDNKEEIIKRIPDHLKLHSNDISVIKTTIEKNRFRGNPYRKTAPFTIVRKAEKTKVLNSIKFVPAKERQATRFPQKSIEDFTFTLFEIINRFSMFKTNKRISSDQNNINNDILNSLFSINNNSFILNMVSNITNLGLPVFICHSTEDLINYKKRMSGAFYYIMDKKIPKNIGYKLVLYAINKGTGYSGTTHEDVRSFIQDSRQLYGLFLYDTKAAEKDLRIYIKNILDSNDLNVLISKFFDTLKNKYYIEYNKKTKYHNNLIPHTLVRSLWESPEFVTNYLKARRAYPKLDKYALLFLYATKQQHSSYGHIANNNLNNFNFYIGKNRKDYYKKMKAYFSKHNNSSIVNYYEYLNLMNKVKKGKEIKNYRIEKIEEDFSKYKNKETQLLFKKGR